MRDYSKGTVEDRLALEYARDSSPKASIKIGRIHSLSAST